MNVSELINKIENGNDIELTICDKKYTILTWCEEGIFIDEQYPNDGHGSYFKTAQDLVNLFQVNGTPICELLDSLSIDYYS